MTPGQALVARFPGICDGIYDILQSCYFDGGSCLGLSFSVRKWSRTAWVEGELAPIELTERMFYEPDFISIVQRCRALKNNLEEQREFVRERKKIVDALRLVCYSLLVNTVQLTQASYLVECLGDRFLGKNPEP